MTRIRSVLTGAMERIHRGLTLIKMLNPTNEGNDLPSISDSQGREIWQDAICTAQNMDGVVKKIKAVP